MIFVQMFLSPIHPLVIRNDGRVTDIISRLFVKSNFEGERDLGIFGIWIVGIFKNKIERGAFINGG